MVPRRSFVRGRFRAPLLSAGIMLVAYWATAAVVLAVDPYDLYPWGRRPMVAAGHFQRGTHDQLLVSAAAKDPTWDVVSIGSSTARMYSAREIAQAFPGTRSALNVAYAGSRPMDRHMVVTQFVRHSAARRLLIWFDWTYALAATDLKPAFPSYMYDDAWLNDLRLVTPPSLISAWHMLSSGEPFPDAPETTPDREKTPPGPFQTRRSMDSIARVVELNRATVDLPTERTCDQFDALRTQAVPAARALAARGTQVDFVLPAYSLVFYYPSTRVRGDMVRLSEQLLLRRCLVEETAGIPGVRVVALDRDLHVVSDLGNYRDDAHLYYGPGLRVLERFVEPAYELTPANIDHYVNTLREAVKHYRVVNSHLASDVKSGS